jgi:hypothetical protein
MASEQRFCILFLQVATASALPADETIELKGKQKEELCQDADVESEVRLLKESSRQGRGSKNSFGSACTKHSEALAAWAFSDCPLFIWLPSQETRLSSEQKSCVHFS